MPGKEELKQAIRHRSSFVGEASEFFIERIKTNAQGSRVIFLEGGVVALKEHAADMLEPGPNSGISHPESAPGESGLAGRNPQDKPPKGIGTSHGRTLLLKALTCQSASEIRAPRNPSTEEPRGHCHDDGLPQPARRREVRHR
jgi:hypothetical protein